MFTQDGIKERFISDLKEVTLKLVKLPPKGWEGQAAMYGMAQSLPDTHLIDEIAERFVDTLYSTK